MDNISKTQTVYKTGIMKSFSLRHIFIILGFVVTLPVTYMIAYNFDIQIHRMVVTHLLSVFIILLANFRKSTHATMQRFMLRLLLAFITGFVVFFGEPIMINIALTAYTMILLSVLSYGLSDDYQKLSIISMMVFVFNFLTGFILQINADFGGFGPLHGIFITISTVAVFVYFMLLNIDTSRRFGNVNMKIPSSMNRAAITILAAVSLLMLIITLMPWIQNVIEALIIGITGVIMRFFRFLLTSLQREYRPVPNEYFPDSEPLIDDGDIIFESSEVNPVVMWLLIGLFLLVLSALIIFAFIKLILLLFKLLKSTHQRAITDNEVFIETIEKIEQGRKKRIKRSRDKRTRYSSLQTESERIKCIYNEYVRRAKRNGYTQDANSDTPNEVLDEVIRSIQDNQGEQNKSFPLPGNLANAFNTVRYGNFGDNTNKVEAHEFLHLK